MSQSIIFNPFTKAMVHGNRAIIGNRRNGKWIKISKECYEILKLAEGEKATTNELIEAFEDKGDQEYFKELLRLLFAEDLLIAKEELIHFDKDLSVDIAVTNRCNLKCTHCCVDADFANLMDPMDTYTLKDVIKKVVTCRPKRICLTGGEPLIRKDFFEILTYLRDLYEGEIRIMTNGTLINQENVEMLVACANAIDISIDGVNEETCSNIRGKGVFKRVVDSIHLLKAHHFNKISLSMVLTKENYRLRDQFQALNDQLGTRGITRAFSPIGRGDDNKSSLQPKEEEALFEEERMKKVTQDDIHVCMCGALFKEFYINYEGNIYPCGLMEKDEYCVGNILNVDNFSNFLAEGAFKVSVGYSNWQRLQPDQHEKCKDCDVNLFCWNCLHYLDLVEGNETFFKEVCPELKRNYQDIVWGDDKCC